MEIFTTTVILQGGFSGVNRVFAPWKYEIRSLKKQNCLCDTFTVNQKEFPVFKFPSIFFLSDVHAFSNKPFYVLLCWDSFSS